MHGTAEFTKRLSFAVSPLQTGVADLWLHTGVPQLITRPFIEWLSTHTVLIHSGSVVGAAAPANVHVVYSTTAGSGLQHTTVGNHTHAPKHAHTPSGYFSLCEAQGFPKCSSSFCRLTVRMIAWILIHLFTHLQQLWNSRLNQYRSKQTHLDKSKPLAAFYLTIACKHMEV